MNVDLSAVAEDGSNRNGNVVPMKITEVFYEVESGYGELEMPIVFVCGRTHDGRTVVRVRDFYPFFFIAYQEFVQRRDDIESEMGKDSPIIIDYEQGYTGMGKDALEGDVEIVKLYCQSPKMVGGEDGIVHEFERTWEGDVKFADRFLTSMGIKQYAEIPSELSGTHSLRDVRPNEIEAIEP